MRKPSQAVLEFYTNMNQARLLLGELSQQLESWKTFNEAALIRLASARKWETEETGDAGKKPGNGSTDNTSVSGHSLPLDRNHPSNEEHFRVQPTSTFGVAE